MPLQDFDEVRAASFNGFNQFPRWAYDEDSRPNNLCFKYFCLRECSYPQKLFEQGTQCVEVDIRWFDVQFIDESGDHSLCVRLVINFDTLGFNIGIDK